MDAKQFLKEKGISNSDFMDSGVADLIETLLTEYQALQLKQGAVMWRCSRQFRMKEGKKEICFKNGGIYKQAKEQPLTLIDEDGICHELSSNWVKWFHNVT